MIPRTFESEFSADKLPAVSGQPMAPSDLDSQASQRGLWVRAERAQQNAVVDAVYGFYLAKHFAAALSGFNGWTNRRAEAAIDAVRTRLWKSAVIDVAGMNDAMSPKRVASLQSILTSMREVLNASQDPSAAADLQAVEDLRARTNADTVVPLKYARHVRNKWAGHPSMDREFDSWADADSILSVPLLEEALAVMVRAHHDAASLASRSTVLAPLFAVPVPEQRTIQTDEGPIRVTPMTVEWSNVTSAAEVMREAATKAAFALVDQLTSPPGYGAEDDTDIDLGSAHQQRRAAIDGVVRQYLSSEQLD